MDASKPERKKIAEMSHVLMRKGRGIQGAKMKKDPLQKVRNASAIHRRDSFELAEERRKKKQTIEEKELQELLSRYGGARRNSCEREILDEPFCEDAFEEEFKEEDSAGRAKANLQPSESGARKPVRGILKTAKKHSQRNDNNGRRRVTFNKSAQLHFMPAHEYVAARRSRKGPWEPAPEHDELWDGDLQDFRPLPLTPKQLKDELRRKEREYMHDYGAQGLNFTYPPSSYEYAYSDADLDELDSYLNDSFSSSLDSQRLSSLLGKEPRVCYLCRPPLEWSATHVAAWVQDRVANGEFFFECFEKNFIDGPMLLQMEERDLRNIGIRKSSDRQAILSAKVQLKRDSFTRSSSCACATF